MISYGKQFIDSSDIAAVRKVLRSNWLTQGPLINKFELKLKKYFGAKYCSVVSNGTGALHLAGLALGWKKGDIILTSPISFLASSNCILYSGATPDFIDIDKNNYNIDINKLEQKLKKLKSSSKKVVAVVATDYAGNPCNWKDLRHIASKYNIKLINDNCHAIGATYYNDKSYAVKYADVVTHSYHPVKNITTGEGGAVLTNNKEISEKVNVLRSHGIIKSSKATLLKKGLWHYEMNELGYNYRITDIQCALGISQLKKINKFIKRKKEIARIYDEQFSRDSIFKIPKVEKNYGHAYHLYPLQINFNQENEKRFFFNELYSSKIKLQVHYIPIHLQPYYRKNYGFKRGDYPVAENFYKKEVSLPIYFSLKKNEIYRVINKIKIFLRKK